MKENADLCDHIRTIKNYNIIRIITIAYCFYSSTFEYTILLKFDYYQWLIKLIAISVNEFHNVVQILEAIPELIMSKITYMASFH
jgi:hypothetical protein